MNKLTLLLQIFILEGYSVLQLVTQLSLVFLVRMKKHIYL